MSYSKSYSNPRQSSREYFSERDVDEHAQNYRDFLRILRWSVAAIVAVLIGLAAVTV